MADVNSNININIDASEALATIKALQRQISAFHTSMAKSGAAANAVASNMQQNLLNAVNATGKWQASFKTIPTTTESFTRSLEKNKFTMREYFRYAGASTRSFGKLFRSEFDTVNKVARERVKDLQTQYIKLGRDASGAMKSIAVRPLALDMKDYGTQVQIAAQRQQILNQLLKQGSTNLLNFGKNTQWAGRQLMVGFTIPLVYLGTAAGKTFMKLEEQAIRFKRVYGEMFTTGAETDKMLKEIELLAKQFTKYGVSVEKTMEMAATAAASGKMGAELLAQVNEATRLAVLGGVEQEQALETTISLTNAFGLAAEDLAKKINFLNAVENQTVVSIEDLTIAIPKAGPVVEQLGGSVEDLAFFLTAMKEGGINASEGANALKSGLASLINPTDKAAEMLGSMGINIQAIVEANKGNVKQVVIDFAAALDTLDPLNRARAIEQLFGKFQFARLSTLFQNVIAEGNQASRVLNLTKATTEELAILSERELARVEESTTYKFKKTIEDLKVTLAPVGEQFLKALTPIVEFVSGILEKFNNLGDGTKKFITILTVLLGGIGPIFLMTFGLLANGLANIIKLFASIKGVMNRAGQSSQTLGQQTDYMTTEQMQAATVAASLEQVHARLIQTFTSEASAVAALTTAYKNAIAAQVAFTGPVRGGTGKAPKKLNRGTTNVRYYAKGTDTVPAMLTPGEAVIPAGAAQNPGNKPAIATMVAGGVVGYAGGTVNVGGQGYGLSGGTQSTMAAIQRKIDASMGQIDDIIAQALKNLAGETKLKVKQFQNEVRAIAKSRGVDAGPAFAKKYETRERGYSAAKAGERRNVRTQLIDERGAKAAAAEMAKANAAAKAIEKTLKEYGATTSQIANATQIDRSHMIRVDNEQKKILKVWHSNVWTAQTGAENNAILDSLRKSSRYRELYKEYLIKTGATESQVASIMTNINNGVALTDEQLDVQGRALRRIAADAKTNADLEKRTSRNFIMYSDAVGQAALARAKVLARQPAELKALTVRNQAAMQQIANELPNAAAVALQTKSPSRKMRKVGQDAGAGIVVGAREFVDDAKVAGEQIGAAASTGVTQGGRRGRRGAAMTQGAPGEGRMYNPLAAAPQGAKLLPIVPATPPVPPKPTLAQRFKDRQTARAEAGKTGMGVGGGMMAASGVMMAASMAPGAVGETAQKLMMPMMALTMLLPMLNSKVGLVTMGFAAIVAAAVALRMAFDKAQDSAMKLNESLGGGSQAIRDFSKFAGTVSAGEVMDRRRAATVSPFQIKTGKTTFGSAFVQSQQGKDMVANVGANIKQSGRAGAASQLVNQLATSVAAGALTAQQARSVVANIGEQLGDYGFSINVNAKLIELLGPNGENLAKDPLSVRVKLLEESRGKMGTAARAAQQTGGLLTSRNTTRSTALIGGGAGVLGAIGGAAFTGTRVGAAIGSVVPGFGTGMGAAIGAGVGALVGAGAHYFQQKKRQEQLGTASGAQIAMTKIAMQQQQEMLDSLDIQYEKEMAIAKAKGDQNKIDELQDKYLKNRISLLEENKKLMQDLATSFDKAGGDVQKALLTGVDKAITKQYKGTGMEDVATLASQQIGASAATQTQQYQLKVLLSTGDIDPMQMISFMESFGQDKGTITKILEITTKFGAGTTNQMAQVAGMFVDKDGNPVKSVQTQFISLIEAQTDNKEADKLIAFYAKVAQTGNVLNTSIITDFLLKNPAKAKALREDVEAIAELKGPITVDVVTNILNADALAALNEDLTYFNGLSDEEKKIYLQTLAVTMSTVSADDPALKNWLNSEGSAYKNSPPGVQLREYAQWNSKQVTETATPPPAPATGGDTPGDKKGPDPSALDDLTKKLRDVQKNQIKVTTGWSASMAALRKFAGDASKTALPFSGIEQDLTKLRTSMGKPLVTGNFIDFITGMDPAEYEKRKKQLFKFDAKGNIVGLKKDAKTIQEVLNSIVAGDFQSNLKRQKVELENQTVAYEKLVKLGVPVSEAYELIADASFAAMIATIKNKDKVKELIKEYNLFKKTLGETENKKAFDLGLEELEKAPANIENQRKAVALLTAQGVSYGDALAFVQDETVANHVANATNAETLTRLAEAAKKAAAATKQFGLEQQFAARIQDFKDTLENFNNQRKAITKLVAAGFSLADAYSIVQDTAIAATIAQSANNELIKNTGRDALAAADALKKMAAAQNIVAANQATAETRSILAFLNANKGKFTNEQIKAILENKDLQTLILNPSIDPAALQQAIDNAAMAADLEFQIKKLTIEGMEDIFNDGYNKAMEAFDAEERAINLKFKADTASLTDPETGVIPVAENAIAQLQYQIDDWEASLKGIEDQEKLINESYDEKIKALDQVQKINEKIARQQQQQLTLADALSRGDISAAAATIQEMRAANAADQVDTQRQSLEAAKEYQLANARNALGMTRKQIEDQIKNLQKQIFEIEEKQLEPAREALRLRERQRDIDVSNITVLGRTKDAWELIKNGIDLAKTRSDVYKDAMQAALDIVKDIEDYWNNKVPKEKTTIHNIITKYSTEGSPADCCQGANNPDPGPDPYTSPCPKAGTVISTGNCVNGKKEIKVADGNCGTTTNTEDCAGSSPCPPGFVLNSRGSCAPESDPNQPYSGPSTPKGTDGSGAKGGYTAPSTPTPSGSTPTSPNLGNRPLGAGVVVGGYTAPKPVTGAMTDTAPHYLGFAAGSGTKTSGYTAPKPVTGVSTDTAPHALGMSGGTKTTTNKSTGSNTVPTTSMPFGGQSVGTGGSTTKDAGTFPLSGNPKSGTATATTKTTTTSTTSVTLPFGGSILIPNLGSSSSNNTKGSPLVGLLPLPLPISTGGGYSGPRPPTLNKSSGGFIKRFLGGGFARGTDIVPAMLTPGEFVVSRPAVREYGVDKLRAINDGNYDDSSVYNYNLSVTLNGSDMNPNEVANVVLQKIKQLDSQRIRRQVV